jgi:hypothetical protein
MTSKKNNLIWLLLLIPFLFSFKKKNSGTQIIVDEPLPAKSSDADVLVKVTKGSKLFNLSLDGTFINDASPKDIFLDGFKDTHFPTFIKVRTKNGTFYYVKDSSYTIV